MLRRKSRSLVINTPKELLTAWRYFVLAFHIVLPVIVLLALMGLAAGAVLLFEWLLGLLT
jgi:hypothetical protein